MKKKILSLLLTLCLVMTFVPMAAFAEDAEISQEKMGVLSWRLRTEEI